MDAPAPDPQQALIAAAAAVPVVEPEVTTPPPAPAEPGPAPWASTLAASFEDEAERSRVDAYLREHHQPYVTKVEAERAAAKAAAEAAEEKAWVYDSLSGDDPATALADIAEQLYPGLGERVAELVTAGVAPEAAAEQAAAEEAAPALDPAVAELVEWAKAERERQAAATAEQTQAAALAEATEVLNAWAETTLAANPDIASDDLMAYIVAQQGDMDAALAAYRVSHPAPPAAPAPPTVGGRSAGGIMPARRASTLAEAAGSVFDAASGN